MVRTPFPSIRGFAPTRRLEVLQNKVFLLSKFSQSRAFKKKGGTLRKSRMIHIVNNIDSILNR
jgi:hypothetical protein